jgi:hypothetical protein
MLPKMVPHLFIEEHLLTNTKFSRSPNLNTYVHLFKRVRHYIVSIASLKLDNDKQSPNCTFTTTTQVLVKPECSYIPVKKW